MAHTCPECGILCHCRGDIDDCEMDGTEEQLMCEHCDEDESPCDDDPTEVEDNRQFSKPILNSKTQSQSKR